MNISEVKRLVIGASYEKEIEVLETICEYAGDCVMNGYLGSAVSSISYDENGKVEFDSEYECDGLVTKSTGAVLDSSVVIKQVQEQDSKKYYQLFSWKQDGTSYSYLAFDSEEVLQQAYNGLKNSSREFLDDNISQTLEELGVSFDNVMDVKVAQDVEQQSISVDDLLDAYDESLVSDNLEVSKSIA